MKSDNCSLITGCTQSSTQTAPELVQQSQSSGSTDSGNLVIEPNYKSLQFSLHYTIGIIAKTAGGVTNAQSGW